jgi:GNAT superfamily N-acetyltransferase
MGYSPTAAAVAERLEAIAGDADGAVFVVEAPGGAVVGWVHACVYRPIHNQTRAVIGGLVVDEAHRRSGLGRMLIRRVEQWTRRKGCPEIRVGSQHFRTEAHAFYEALGYRPLKVHHVFRADLSETAPPQPT